MPTLTSISEFCSESNLSGLVEIEYVPTAWIDAAAYEYIISNSNNWQYDLIFTTGDWMTAGLLQDPRKKVWNENQRNSNQGPTYEQSVSGNTPKMKPAVNLQFQEMANYRYILRLTDLNNQTWIIGTLDEPFTFSASATLGNNGSTNQYTISFESSTSKRAKGFVPVL